MSLAEAIENCTTNAPKGFAVLMERGPEGWLNDVPLNDLDMGSCSRCVLAHVYGGYDMAVQILSGTDDFDAEVRWAYAHGFDRALMSQVRSGEAEPVEYGALKADWTALIKAARAEAV